MKKRFHSGVPIILPILFALIYLLAVVTRSKDEVYSILMGAPPSDPLIFSIVVGGIVLLLLWVWSEWVYYIEFGENELVFKRRMLPFLKPAKVSYSEIFYVCRSDVKAVLSVFLLNGKEIRFPVSVSGSVDQLIAEFQKHVPQNHIQPEIESVYKKINLYEVVLWLFVGVYVAATVFVVGGRKVSSFIAWNSVWPPFFASPTSVESYWVNRNGEVWLALDKVLFGDGWKIVKLTSDHNQDVVLHIESSLVEYPDLVLADENDHPWIIQREALYHWTGANWDAFGLNGYEIRAWRYPVTIGDTYWTSAFKDDSGIKFLFSLNLNTAEIRTYQLPQELIPSEFFIYDVRPGMGGYPLVMFTKEYGPVYFYLFENGEWRKVGEILDVEWALPEPFLAFPASEKPNIQFEDFTVDDNGQIWVVLERDFEPVIGRLPVGRSEWEWSSIKNKCDECSQHYTQIAVDSFQRVWLAGEFEYREQWGDTYRLVEDRGCEVFSPRWSDYAVLITSYGNRNSGFARGYGPTGLKISSDNKIWSGNWKGLAWIDATKDNLPKPLPFNTTLISIPVGQLLYFVILVFIPVFYRLFFRRYYLPPLPKKNS